MSPCRNRSRGFNCRSMYKITPATPLQEESLFTNSPLHSLLSCLLPSNASLSTKSSSLHLQFCIPIFLVQFLESSWLFCTTCCHTSLISDLSAHLNFFDLIVLIISCSLDFFIRSSSSLCPSVLLLSLSLLKHSLSPLVFFFQNGNTHGGGWWPLAVF